jgi:hypothetical protein
MTTARACLLIGVAVQVTTALTLRAQDSLPAGKQLNAMWSVPGPWTGVATDESGTIYAVGRGGRSIAVDPAGGIQREVRLGSEPGLLRLAKLPGPTLLTFGVWSTDLRAYDINGKPLWTYPRATGIDDVWAGDVDGDQVDEVIVGYNGPTGLHVLDGMGRVRWTSTAIGNVWHVSAGDVLGEGRSQIVTTSAAGSVHVFSGDGRQRLDIRTPLYANMVRVRKLRAIDSAATIIIGGSTNSSTSGMRSTIVAAVSRNGSTMWRLEFGQDPLQSAELAPVGPWLALGVAGSVYVVDAEKGDVIGQVAGQVSAQVAWDSAGNSESPVLLVATGSALNAFRVQE